MKFHWSPRMRVHILEASLWVGRGPEEVFPYFSSAANLERMTPPFLHFRILTPPPIEMRKGTRIDYRLRLHGFPVRWRTEITAWEPPRRFVDEQVRGPFRLWIHEHTFEEQGRGTLCKDLVTYRVPGGPRVERLLVRRDIQEIFEFRQAVLSTIFRGEQRK